MEDLAISITVDILRHGQPEGGEVLRGRIDHPLAEQGWAQMWQAAGLTPRPTAEQPETTAWTEIVSSPLQRCRDFAEKLAGRTGLPVTVEPDWQEIDYGDWDGMPLSEWHSTAAYQFRAFRKDMTALQPPNGEAFTGFRDRVLDAWERILNRPDGSRILLITHGGVMRVVLPTVLGIPLNRTGVLEIPFACLSRVKISHRNGQRVTSLLGHNIGQH